MSDPAPAIVRRFGLLRHGEAAGRAGLPDAERPLTDAGRRDAARVGAAAADRRLLPDYVVTSPATRARQTWSAYARGLGGALDPAVSANSVSIDARIYANHLDGLLGVVRETPDDYASLLLVGHNPGLAELAALFADVEPTSAAAGLQPSPAAVAAWHRLGGAYPTSTVAVFVTAAPWEEVRPGTAVLSALLGPDLP